MTDTTTPTIATTEFAAKMLSIAIEGARMRSLMTQDLITPLVVTVDPGCGFLATAKALAAEMDADFLDVRCGQLNAGDMRISNVLKGGEIVTHMPSLAWLRNTIEVATTRPAMLSLDGVSTFPCGEALIAQVAREARRPVVVLLPTRSDQRDATIEAVSNALGLPTAMVETCGFTTPGAVLAEWGAFMRERNPSDGRWSNDIVDYVLSQEEQGGASLRAWAQLAQLPADFAPAMLGVMRRHLLGDAAAERFETWLSERG